MTPEDLVGKKIRLTKRFICNLNVFKKGDILRVLSLYEDGAGIVLRDRHRPDIRLVLGADELKYCHIIHDSGRCYNCGQDVTSKDGRNCPLCNKPMWELMARHADDPRGTKS